MPLYEFRCPKCGAEFEHIVFCTDKDPVKCPTCGAPHPERLLSVFSSGRTSGAGTASATSSCTAAGTGFS
ncbi:MAG: zinc ribbon domain-containing protein [Thermodesulfobacteriota bacterium]|nr:zinc ribbon domain-containing protein [Thermodesulfobacteriota bacterium]